MTTNELCVICHEPIDAQPNGWAYGHNAQPIAEGQCCTDCNIELVIPARMENLTVLIENPGKWITD